MDSSSVLWSNWQEQVGKCPTGKFTEGWTDFALKGGNLLWMLGIGASSPGHAPPAAASSIDIL